ncbi:MAG: hypothetical protein H6R04_700 [Burkholderiaceae bacterium]|nr:hypothetical protein [Burkholderiaceae bacterium]
MSKTLSLGIVLTALGAGSVMGVIGGVSDRISSIGRTVEKLQGQQKTALAAMDREWVWGGNSVKKYLDQVEKLDRKIETLSQRKIKLEALGAAHAANRADLNSRMGDVAAAYGIGKMMGTPIGAFVRQDDALNSLEVAMMERGGKIDATYGKLRSQIVELGNKLPGTTADYANLTTTMLSLGIPAKNLLGGALDAAANLRVVLKMTSESAGETVVKLREAYNLTDAELAKTADITQRAKFAFGMKPEDLRVAASYQAAQLNILHLSGAENMKKMLVMQGMANLKGLDGSSFGTNMSMMLTRLALGPKMLEMAKRGMKGVGKDILSDLKITFDFFDKKGNFRGLDAMIKEFEKFKLIEAKYGQKGVSIVSNALFGIEAARPAMILAEYGSKGYAEAQKRFDEQASLQERIGKTLQSSRNTWEALTGSVENFAAAAVGPAVQSLHPLINGLNTLAGNLTDFAEANPKLAKYLGLTIATVAAGTVAFLGLGVAMSFFRFAVTGAQLIPGVLSLGRGLTWLVGIVRGGALLSGLRAIGLGFLFMGKMMLLSPVTWILGAVALIAGGAYLIYRNWDRIGPLFGRVWNTVKSWTNSAISWFTSLPERFYEFGTNIVTGLINGITSKFAALKKSVVAMGASVAETYQAHLGIHSPSRVFIGFGQNIGEGAAIGISSSSRRARAAAAGMALATAAAWGQPQLAADFSSRVGKANASLNSGGNSMAITFAPQITVQGGDPAAMRGQVNQAMQMSFEEFERFMRRYQKEGGRTAYGRNA